MYKWFVGIAVPVLVIWLVWSLFGFHVSEPRGPISAAKATKVLGVPVPPEARNIRGASHSQWQEYAVYLRFEAPTDVCLHVAAACVPGEELKPADEYVLAGKARPLRADAFDDFSWFDLDKAQDVLTAGGGPSKPQVWVDRSRGVFYFRQTD